MSIELELEIFELESESELEIFELGAESKFGFDWSLAFLAFRIFAACSTAATNTAKGLSFNSSIYFRVNNRRGEEGKGKRRKGEEESVPFSLIPLLHGAFLQLLYYYVIF